MIKPFVACLFLVGIHAYLGWHVIERGIIFVDLALAQIAALGAAIALISGFSGQSWQGYVITLSFTLLGAGVLSLTGSWKSKIPQEAVIGIIYAAAASTVVLILHFSPSGDEHLKQALTGNLLFVDGHKLRMLALIYGAIGFVHWMLRKPFMEISQNHDKAEVKPVNQMGYDFLFLTFLGNSIAMNFYLKKARL